MWPSVRPLVPVS